MSWIRAHIQPLIAFVGAVLIGLKPWILGGHYGPHEWLSVAILAAGAIGTYIVPNLNVTAATYAKDAVLIITAGASAAINVLPGGISRADAWVIGSAIFAVIVPLVIPNTTQKAVLVGTGQMGDGGHARG